MADELDDEHAMLRELQDTVAGLREAIWAIAKKVAVLEQQKFDTLNN